MVDKNILVAKVASIEKALRKVREKAQISLEQFKTDEDSQDIVLFNLMQAIQGCVDLAAHIVSDEALGMAGSMHEFFYLLHSNNIITIELQERMIRAVGLRNLIAHEYARLNLDQAYQVAQEDVNDLEEFVAAIVQRFA